MRDGSMVKKRDDRPRRTTVVRHWLIAKPHDRLVHVLITAGLILVGLGCAAAAVVTELHPVFYSTFGAGQTAQLPQILGGVILLWVPAGLLGVAVYRLWWAAAMDLEVRRQRRRHSPRTSR
jgi:hypothetical protein